MIKVGDKVVCKPLINGAEKYNDKVGIVKFVKWGIYGILVKGLGIVHLDSEEIKKTRRKLSLKEK